MTTTDEEIRGVLRHTFEEQARWNLEAAAILDRLAATDEEHLELLRVVGFDSYPSDAEEFVRTFIASCQKAKDLNKDDEFKQELLDKLLGQKP
jgi:hypothetical protein